MTQVRLYLQKQEIKLEVCTYSVYILEDDNNIYRETLRG